MCILEKVVNNLLVHLYAPKEIDHGLEFVSAYTKTEKSFPLPFPFGRTSCPEGKQVFSDADLSAIRAELEERFVQHPS